jgi:ABC-type glycerol-3-phosphate transport system permease component
MTSIVGVSPGRGTNDPAARHGAASGGAAPGSSARARWRTRLARAATPVKLRLLLVFLVLLSLAWGAVAALTAEQHAVAAASVVAVSEPLSLDAELIYQSLSDADATEANAFLAGGLEPAAARQRYNADVAQAAIRIEAASTLVGPGDAAIGADLATLSAQLPVYADEVGTARADNRLGLPLGAAYLREASALVRGTLLPTASDIYTRESGLLTSSSAQATGLPLIVLAVLIGLGIGYLLYRASRWLTRRTHRVVNYGLLLAALAGLVSLVWLAAAFGLGRTELLHAQQHGSGPAQAFARADVAALRAHADESLTLIDNSGDDSYQQDFLLQRKLLGPGPGTLLAALQASGGSNGTAAAADAQAWYQAHAALRALDDGGNHTAAVASALSGDSAASFDRLSAVLGHGIGTSQAVFATSARQGRDAFTGLAPGMIVASLLMAAGCAWGLNRRLAEYR